MSFVAYTTSASRWTPSTVVGVFSAQNRRFDADLRRSGRRGIPSPIQHIQTDRDQEFFANRIQDRVQQWSIKFRPIRPRAPDLNGKIERVRRAALEEYCRPSILGGPEPEDSLGGLPPIDRVCDLLRQAPTGEEIAVAYDSNREFILPRND